MIKKCSARYKDSIASKIVLASVDIYDIRVLLEWEFVFGM